MKYIAILCALAVACLIAVPAISAANDNLSATNVVVPGENCSKCNGNGLCGAALGNQNQYGQDNAGYHGACNCAGDGKCDGNGPKNGHGYKKGNCDGTGPKNGNCNGNGFNKGNCDGTGPKRDGSCKAA